MGRLFNGAIEIRLTLSLVKDLREEKTELLQNFEKSIEK